MLKAKDLRDQSVEELEASYLDLCKQLFLSVGELKQSKKADKPHKAKETRRDIARVLTVLNEKRLSANERG